ncbi:hypothetical protein CEW88_03390 [Alloyangia pacifica]|uniref:Uncharacterized protein n=1 Tax=Alloyangia pacifica TaxID=311180 RepID=A0A2U8HB20_9RHOB|nr:hypothetical protein [Alloyangia pacifica]AWI82790.1 hypothetical protein CEW88_03390 [Alloyangia pacifica]
MPKLVRLYITQCAIGFGLSAGFVALLLWQNVGNLQHLVTHTDAGMLAVFLLWLFNGLVFAGAQFAMTVMRMSGDHSRPAGGKRMALEPMPIRIPVEQKPRRLL